MPYKDSYLWRLRQVVGHDLVLMPGAMLALQQDDQRVLLTRRTTMERGAYLPGRPSQAGALPARRSTRLRTRRFPRGSDWWPECNHSPR